jgi:general secretion pathway protein G
MKIQEKQGMSDSTGKPCRLPGNQGTVLDNRGFTLIELIIVSLVLMILVAMAIPSYINYTKTARVSRAAAEIRTLEAAITAHYNDRGAYPAGLADVGFGTLSDPWGRAYHYTPGGGARTFAGQQNSDFDLWSDGDDGRTDASGSLVAPDSKDDIIRFSDGSFCGLAVLYGNPP